MKGPDLEYSDDGGKTWTAGWEEWSSPHGRSTIARDMENWVRVIRGLIDGGTIRLKQSGDLWRRRG